MINSLPILHNFDQEMRLITETATVDTLLFPYRR